MLRLCVAYDGSGFSGYQVQPGQRTVQGVLESALGKLAKDEVRIRAAGRTDAGVHALGQVVSVNASSLEPAMVQRGMPALLPPDVAVLDAQPADNDFDARHSARSRMYAYLLWCAGAPHPLYRKYAVWPRAAFDASLASRALQAVVGTHDFSSFSRVRSDQSPERTVLEAHAVADGPFVRIKVVAESFLHQMVRSIVGTAIEIGAGRKPVAWMREVLEARDRSAAGPVAPAHGLTLVDVSYDGVEWPNRPAVTWPWSGLAYVNSQRGCA
ncbi:MAG: tRNA pseudouridine(38-40) synthase TruA [Actinomycetota bacterium]